MIWINEVFRDLVSENFLGYAGEEEIGMQVGLVFGRLADIFVLKYVISDINFIIHEFLFGLFIETQIVNIFGVY